MKIHLQPDEKLVREGRANLQRGMEAVGGKLFLTDQRLFFQSHAYNVQAGPTQIALSDVRGAQLCWTKFLGLIPLFPNSLAVQTASGSEYRFVLSSREQWAAAIGAQAQLAGATIRPCRAASRR
ncbi:GRAM domain-containing protein [Lysobacter sp. D1-1-M9]|uniref:GRAM domain-containing protein n=1 Tax=Novilysobacter longmucuonensis TaxID=3098603 RepID=UPI002FCB7954